VGFLDGGLVLVKAGYRNSHGRTFLSILVERGMDCSRERRVSTAGGHRDRRVERQGGGTEVCIAAVVEGHEAHVMSMVDGEGIGTILLLGGHGCDQGGLTAFPAFPRSHPVGDKQTRPHDDTCRSVRSLPFSASLEGLEAGGDELDASRIVSDIWLNGGEEEEDDACGDHHGG